MDLPSVLCLSLREQLLFSLGGHSSLHSPFWIPNRKYKYWIFHQSQINYNNNNSNNNNKRSLLVEYYRLDEVSTTTQPSATPIPPTLFAIITNPDWIIIIIITNPDWITIIIITNPDWIIIIIIISKVLMKYSSRYILVKGGGIHSLESDIYICGA